MDKIRIELSRRRRVLAVAPLAYVAALVSGGVRAPIASATTDYCNPRGLPGVYYGTACLFAPSGTTFKAVSGYIESSELSTPNDGSHIIDDMYIVNPYANPPPPSTNVPDFIEAGIFSGNICITADHNFGDCTPSGYQQRLLFWGDDRQNSGYNAHFEGVASLGTQYVDEIDHEPPADSDVWEVALGPYLGYSTNNELEPSLIRTGTEEAPQNEADACSEQSDLWYADQNYNWHDGWGSASAVVYDSPPYAKWVTAGSSVLDWAWGSQSYSKAESTCWPSDAVATSPPSSPPSPPTSPTASGPPSSSSSATGTGSPLTEAQISQLAGGFAAGMGDATPTSIEYVASTRQQAVLALSGDEVSTNPDVDVIVMTGNFVGTNAPTAGGVPSGSVLTMVINATTGALTDFGIRNQVPDLTSLGPITLVH